MKRTAISLTSLLVLSTLFTLTSCNKEEASNGTQFRASMEDCTGQNGKTTLSGTALNWVSGDRIAVYGTDGCGIYSATPQEPATTAIFDNVSGEIGDPTFRAFYPTTLTTDGVNITLPATQTYVENSIHEFPMYAESSDNTLAFKNLCGALKLHLTANVNISSIVVTAANEINGTFSVNYNAGDPQLTHVSGGSNTTILSCATAQSIASGMDFFIYLPEGSYSGLQIELNTVDGLSCIKTANTAITVARSQYTLITFNSSDLHFRPIGSVGGLFSINADGDQVWFSQGNLQYQASTGTWRFAENQYDYLGADNANISASYSGWIDLFGWGTGNNPTLSSTDNSDYSTFVDWGTNSISNGGEQTNSWRTLSRDEWDYILNGRSGAAMKYGTCSVNGIYGIVLLPDNWEQPAGVNFTSGYNYLQNNFSLAQWCTMEAAGAVFLPSAGDRYSNIYTEGDDGNYWTSTIFSEAEASDVYFWVQSNAGGVGYYYLHFGFSVRLVSDNN